jgi:hypothetical protein
MRSVVARIYRLIGKTHEDGTPIHILHGSVVMNTVVAGADPVTSASEGR